MHDRWRPRLCALLAAASVMLTASLGIGAIDLGRADGRSPVATRGADAPADAPSEPGEDEDPLPDPDELLDGAAAALGGRLSLLNPTHGVRRPRTRDALGPRTGSATPLERPPRA